MKTLLNITIALYFVFFTLPAQVQESQVYQVLPSSKLSFDGTSTLHDFTCVARVVDGSVVLEGLTPNGTTWEGTRIVSMTIKVPVKKIESGKSSMDENMQEALKAEKYPSITYELKEATLTSVVDSIGNKAMIQAVGTLSVAGVGKTIDMTVEGRRSPDSVLTFKGSKKLLMKDFGVDPPTMFLGTIRTGNEITVKFELAVGKKVQAVSTGK